MTIEELHTNEELRTHEFPVAAKKIFLGHAGVAPLPRRVAEAMHSYTKKCTEGDQEVVLYEEWIPGFRKLAGDFIGAAPEEIAFVGPTSLALSFIAMGLKIRRDQNVVIYHDDYPSNVYPWMTLADRGVQVRFLNIRDYGILRTKDVLGQVDENTRLVALASCHYIAGYRLDLDAIGAYLRRRNIIFSVDAIQTLGAYPTHASNTDFMAADAHKWLLGPCAAGLMYVRKEMQDQLKPKVQGWHNVHSPNFIALDELTYKEDARRYEAGTHNLIGLVGLRAAIELLQEIGVENIGRESYRKRTWLVPALQQKGYTVLNARCGLENSGPMVSFFKPGTDLAPVQSKLEAAGVVASLRYDRKGTQYIRLAPHFYNTDAELHRVLELL